MRKKITFKGCPYVGELNKKGIPHGKGVLKILKDSPLTIPSKNWKKYKKKMEKIDDKIQAQRTRNTLSFIDEDLEERKSEIKIIYNPPKQTHMIEGEYTGQFKNGTLNGYGVLRQKLSDKNKMGIYYKGQFKDNAFNGKGSIPDLKHGGTDWGSYYGQFKNGLKWGYGKETFLDETYIGQFKYGKEHGKGTLIKYKKKFKGTYKNGYIFNGKTIIDVKSSSGVYEGDIKNGEITGWGKLFEGNMRNKLIYEGYFYLGNPTSDTSITHFENLNIHNC